ncbi:MAG: isoprenyl transferase [Limibacillus sp.]
MAVVEPSRQNLEQSADQQGVPLHLAVIMDGNGRWAKARGLPRTAGHKRGADAARRTVTAAAKMGLRFLTLYSFSSENWKRPVNEVNDLMGLLRWYLKNEVRELHKNGIRLRVVGERNRLDQEILDLIEEGEGLTRSNAQMDLIMALSYGSRQEMVAAMQDMARAVAEGRLSPEAIDERAFEQRLWTSDIPDPDLILRTSGEQRLSNFLLWQSAYSELMFVDCLWPDFGEAELTAAIEEFRRRDRRYGASVSA